jgi:hypothetical protein
MWFKSTTVFVCRISLLLQRCEDKITEQFCKSKILIMQCDTTAELNTAICSICVAHMWNIQTDISEVNFIEDLDISQNIVHQLEEQKNLCCLRNIPNNGILPWLLSMKRPRILFQIYKPLLCISQMKEVCKAEYNCLLHEQKLSCSV